MNKKRIGAVVATIGMIPITLGALNDFSLLPDTIDSRLSGTFYASGTALLALAFWINSSSVSMIKKGFKKVF